jgi:hypothetical protein
MVSLWMWPMVSMTNYCDGIAVKTSMGAAYSSCNEHYMTIPLVMAIGDAAASAVVRALTVEIAKMKVGPGTDTLGEDQCRHPHC